MPSLSAYRLTGVSITLDVGYVFTAAPAKHYDQAMTATAPDLGRGVALLGLLLLQRRTARIIFIQPESNQATPHSSRMHG